MTETKKAKGGSQIVKLAVILFLVSAITSGVLGLVNMFTKDIIAEQQRLKTEAAYNAVLPSESGYTTIEFDPDDPAFANVDALSAAGDNGWVVELTFSGAQGSITAGQPAAVARANSPSTSPVRKAMWRYIPWQFCSGMPPAMSSRAQLPSPIMQPRPPPSPHSRRRGKPRVSR